MRTQKELIAKLDAGVMGPAVFLAMSRYLDREHSLPGQDPAREPWALTRARALEQMRTIIGSGALWMSPSKFGTLYALIWLLGESEDAFLTELESIPHKPNGVPRLAAIGERYGFPVEYEEGTL